ncbi:MAG TPA: molecular chaperone DnaK [Candidatus Nanoarchaeia archaeon]|nr:molecular chaperone DnaK [Candidatus Nanoarchaeia archaeon]
MSEMKKEKIIGIDLGTSNSAASVMQAGKPVIIPSAEGASQYGKAFPSVVAFTKDGQLLVGEPARRQAVSNADRTIMAAKRKMGTSFKYKMNNKDFTPQQISAYILQKIKKDAEEFIGESISKAVITVPAYFDDNQRQATKDAGTIAGLEVVRIINEPTAACLAYGLDKQHTNATILVFDLGGGTLDVTVMEFGDGIFEVKSTSGDTQLGGTDMDNAIIDWVVKEFKSKEGVDISKDSTAMQRVREASEKAKIELSTVMESEINLPYLTATAAGPKHLQLKMTRAKLEEIIDPIIRRCKAPLEQAIKDAKLKPNELGKIILVGGPTRMPIVRSFVEKHTGKVAERGIDPMECVAQGAAVQGGVLAGEVKDILLLDVTPLSLGIETLGGVFTKLIERNTTIPTKKSQIFSTAADTQTAVTIRIGQGERTMFPDNKVLGQFDLVGIPPAPRGVPQIEVTFDIDANGILHVTAKDQGTGKEQSIRITAPNKLNEAEVERMKQEAEAHAEEDNARKEKVETIINADATIHQTRKTLEEFKEKIPADVKSKIEEKLKLLEDAKASDDLSAIKSAMEDLNKEVMNIGAQMYGGNAGQGAHAGHAHGSESGDEKVVDAEYTEQKKKKNK